ncbi:Suppressor of the cold-sensitive snRNP biogenesis mutant brr1-1 [Diatrype stigma]|uniref:Suppressor of the cold-sensitive snRNP biogenesis mutant brr1-1 n=1 Tax=Diatrype stigma TaxID=117547 RepID=A0AAN9YVN2_9PEZI
MASFGTRAALFLGAVLPALAAPAPAPAPAALQHGSVVPGKYIISVRPELADDEFESQVQWVADVHRSSISRRDTRGLQKTFSFSGFKAYSGEFDDATVELIKANETVLIVEPDVVVNPLDEFTTQQAAEYNLALLSSNTGFDSRNPVNPYTYDDVAGEGQSVYVVDTGVFVEHEDFEGVSPIS